jgi:hypothetical protein
MSRNRITIAQDILGNLVDAERAVDQSIIASAQLVTSILEGARDVGAAPIFVQEAYASAVSAFNNGNLARSEMIETHRQLARIKDIVLPTHAVGGGNNKSDNDFRMPLTGASGATVSLVPTEAAA